MDIQLRRLDRMLAGQGLALRLADRARSYLADAGYDPTYGARPLKRASQHHLQDPLALAVLEGKFERGGTIVADLDASGGQIVFAKEVVAQPV